MTHDLATRWTLRAIAIAIAVLAALDPAIASKRRTKPAIAVAAMDSHRDSALADRVARELGKTFAVTRAPVSNAEGTVLVGNGLPSTSDEIATPVFAVLPERRPAVALNAVRAPAWTPREARVPVRAVAHIAGARGRTLEVTLSANGLIVDRVTQPVPSDDERVPVSLALVPTAAGVARLRLSAVLAGARDTVASDVAVDVRDQRWRVLFFDPRPSWMSTFVRRAVERDARFVVTSRVVTSRNISTDAGQPPGRLDDLAALGLFDAVVVGAPETLGDNDVVAIDAFLRRRGGGVVLLFDRRAPGRYDKLTNVDTWVDDSTGKTLSVVPINGDSATLRASDLAWPSHLPAGAEAIAHIVSPASDTGRAIVWRSAVGAGRLVVNGALDSWRFRDPTLSGFDRFWTTTIAEAASAAPAPITIHLATAVLAPGEESKIAVSVRDAELSGDRPSHSSVTATLESTTSGAAPISVRLQPSGAAGQFEGAIGAPILAGVYRVVVSADGNRAEAPVVVATNAMHPATDAPDLLTAWVNARGGRALSESRLGELTAALRQAIHPAPHLEIWNPMRSPWWIVPFALALSAEWWLRRRRGMA
ncbi:MAG: hypothetical protein ABJF01_18075 [bacterium]